MNGYAHIETSSARHYVVECAYYVQYVKGLLNFWEVRENLISSTVDDIIGKLIHEK